MSLQRNFKTSNLIAVTAVCAGTNDIVAALATAALDAHTVTVLAIALASLFKLENVTDIPAEDLSSGVVFNNRAGLSGGSCGCKRTGGEGKSHDDGVQLPKDGQHTQNLFQIHTIGASHLVGGDSFRVEGWLLAMDS